MAKYSIEDSTLTNIANAIRAKTGSTAALTPAAMDEALNSVPTQAAKDVTPSVADQTAVAKGVFTTGAVTVKGDANLKAENIAEGVSIFGVVGSHKGGADLQTCTLEWVASDPQWVFGVPEHFVCVYKDGAAVYEGVDPTPGVAVPNVICGSYVFAPADLMYQEVCVTNVVEDYRYAEYAVYKITAQQGETATIRVVYFDF